MVQNNASIQTDYILDAIRDRSVIVIGDVCLDVYYFLDEKNGEVSVETGHPARLVKRWHASLGGAANVAANLKSLGFRDVALVGFVGDDMPGREILRQLESRDIDASGVVTITRPHWSTSVYTKLYNGPVEEPRIDLGYGGGGLPTEEQDLLDRFARRLSHTDIAIVNQQIENGLYTPTFRKSLREILRVHPSVQFFIDTRHYHEEIPYGIHKLNDEEVLRLSLANGIACEGKLPLDQAEDFLRRLHDLWRAPVFVTRAAKGSYVYDGSAFFTVPAIALHEKIDPVGAGDSYIAGIAAAISANVDPVNAARFATVVSGVTLGKLLQTGVATPDEVRSLSVNADFNHNPDIALNPYHRRMVPSTEIEVVTSFPKRGCRFTHIVFDHDGTISVIRQGWEAIMKRMMTSAIFGRHISSAKDSVRASVDTEVDAFIVRTTGIQTIEQMHGFAKMVSSFGFVDESDVLSPAAYKCIYNDELMKIVSQRIEAFYSGRLGVEDLTIKGSISFLRRLAEMKSLTIYLASGTDVEDTRKEAEILGYADVFNGGIYGSVGDPDNDPKKLVMRQIMSKAGSGDTILVFGDGPVEVREVKKQGGYAVGMISDEVRRYGSNLDKRERLVFAGADLLVGDFTWGESLMGILFDGMNEHV